MIFVHQQVVIPHITKVYILSPGEVGLRADLHVSDLLQGLPTHSSCYNLGPKPRPNPCSMWPDPSSLLGAPSLQGCL